MANFGKSAGPLPLLPRRCFQRGCPIPDAPGFGASRRPRLHGFYGRAGEFCLVFPPAGVASAAFARPARRRLSKGETVDILFLATLAAFPALTLALIAGCAALERRK